MKLALKKDLLALEELFNDLVDRYHNLDHCFSQLKEIKKLSELEKRGLIALTMEETQFLIVKKTLILKDGLIDYSLDILSKLEKKLDNFEKDYEKIKYANFV